MRQIPNDFKELMKQRESAASAYVSGDATPLDELLARELPATFFGPGGGYEKGAAHVAEVYAEGATGFVSGTSRLEILQSGADDHVGYWTGIQHAVVQLKGQPEPKPMDLRITEVFMREAGAWKLVHRHADMLTTAKKK
jgi:ketosteroid isomerase-like protein